MLEGMNEWMLQKTERLELPVERSVQLDVSQDHFYSFCFTDTTKIMIYSGEKSNKLTITWPLRNVYDSQFYCF